MCGNGARCFARFVQKLTGREGDFNLRNWCGHHQGKFQGRACYSQSHAAKRFALGRTSRPFHRAPNNSLDQTRECRTRCYSCRTRIKLWSNNLAPKSAITRTSAPKARTSILFTCSVPATSACAPSNAESKVKRLPAGTGVSAAALISSRIHKFGSPVKVQVQDGDQLEVSFEETNGEFADVRLTGPAEFVFEGRVDV